REVTLRPLPANIDHCVLGTGWRAITNAPRMTPPKSTGVRSRRRAVGHRSDARCRVRRAALVAVAHRVQFARFHRVAEDRPETEKPAENDWEGIRRGLATAIASPLPPSTLPQPKPTSPIARSA